MSFNVIIKSIARERMLAEMIAEKNSVILEQMFEIKRLKAQIAEHEAAKQEERAKDAPRKEVR